MNLIIIDHEPYSFRKKLHYYIDEFLFEGWNVEYWSVSEALPYMRNVEYSYKEEECFVKYINDVDEVLERINNQDPSKTILIMEVFYNKSTLEIFKALRRRCFKWVRIDYYFNPTGFINPQLTFWERLANLKASSLVSKINDYFFRLMYKSKKIDMPNILFITGSNRRGVRQAERIVSLNYFDVEVNERLEDVNPPLPYKYIVFLDIMLIDHPDSQRIGENKTIDSASYFNCLNNFFDKVEKSTGYPVVIASHPKANYNKEFGNRLCIKHKTAELSKYSECVLTHGSLSISFALFERKPLVYIYSEKLFRGNDTLALLMQRLNISCKLLNTTKINIDNISDDFKIPKNIDVKKYDSFLDLLYRNKDSQKTNFDILKDNFLNLLSK